MFDFLVVVSFFNQMVIALYILLCFVVSSVAADCSTVYFINKPGNISVSRGTSIRFDTQFIDAYTVCLLYTSDAADEAYDV